MMPGCDRRAVAAQAPRLHGEQSRRGRPRCLLPVTPIALPVIKRLSVAVLLVITASIAGCGDSRQTTYKNFEAANEALKQGWIPAWLPRSAYEIHEIHDLDTKLSMLKFRYQRSETLKLGDDCEPVDFSEALRPSFHVRWWSDDVPGSGPATHRHLLFKCPADRAFVAISPSGEIFHWRP